MQRVEEVGVDVEQRRKELNTIGVYLLLLLMLLLLWYVVIYRDV